MCTRCVGQIMEPDWIEKKRMTIVYYIIIIIIIIIITIISIAITTISVVAIVVNYNVGCLSSAIYENESLFISPPVLYVKYACSNNGGIR